MEHFNSIDEIKRACPNFFKPVPMRGFKSIVYPEIYGGIFFVTSERFTSPTSGEKDPRRFTVRKCVEGDIYHAEYDEETYLAKTHATKVEAQEAARRLACERMGVPYYKHYKSIAEMKRDNKRIGHRWFEPGVMQDFGTVIVLGDYSKIYGGIYFITSEPDVDGARKYAVRACHNGKIDTIGSMCQYDTIKDAQAAISMLIHQDKAIER